MDAFQQRQREAMKALKERFEHKVCPKLHANAILPKFKGCRAEVAGGQIPPEVKIWEGLTFQSEDDLMCNNTHESSHQFGTNLPMAKDSDIEDEEETVRSPSPRVSTKGFHSY